MANYVLEILDGDRAGDVLSLSDRPLRIGRKPGNDLVLADEKTSGVHAEVVFEGDRHVLRDLGSTNGTFLDGKRITEIVLTPGDEVTIGRWRVRFRSESDAAGPVSDSGELAVHRLDAGRLKKRGGSVGVLAGLVVLGLGAGGYLWFQNQQEGNGEATGGPRRSEPAVVAGNKLAQNLAACDSEEGWNLRFAGGGFQPTSRAHTGTGAFEALCAEGKDAPDFAIATLQQPITVLSGRTLTIQAFTRTEGAAQVGVRAVFSAANDSTPFRFRTGTALQPHAEWTAQQVVLEVPPGCDRLQIELVAVFGAAGASAAVDDVAVTEAGQGSAINLKLAESSQTAIGTGTAMAVRSTDPDNPATLLAVLPSRVVAPYEGLHKAGFGALSDVGATWACTMTERSFQLVATGVDGLEFVFPAEAAGSLLLQTAADGAFTSSAAEAQFQARAVVLGSRMTRAMLQFETPVACTGRLGNGLYRLSVAGPKADLVLGFLPERRQAGELLRQAQVAEQENKPGAALDLLRELASKVPQDSEMLAESQLLRSRIYATQAEAVKALQNDLGEALFFDTRGGFSRVALGVADLLRLYGENNLEDLAAVQALRDQAAARLTAMDAAQHDGQRTQLDALGKALEAAQQTALASVVQDYVKRHLGGK